MYTLCTPHVHPMYTPCTPYVHPTYTPCTPYVFGKKRKNTDVITEPADLIHKVVSKANDDAILRATRLHATTPPPRKKKTSRKKKIAKKSSKKKKIVYKTPKKKKRLGGWRGPLPRNAKKENVQRWQVCTIVHNVHNVFLISKSPN